MAKEETTTGFQIGEDALQRLMEGVIKAAKEPNAYEKKKLDNEIRKELAIQKSKEISIIETHVQKIAKFYNCMHEKEDGRLDFVAQVNADGLVRPVCQICGTSYPPFKALPDMITSGVNLQSKELAKRLKKEHLLEMHRRSFPDCKEHCCDQDVRRTELAKAAKIIADGGKMIAEAARA